MDESWVYMPAGTSYVFERWSGSADAGTAPVVLLIPPAARDEARALGAVHARIRETRVLEEAGPLQGAPRRVRLLANIATMPLRYRPGAHMPDIRPLYPEIRRLWRLGFREFEVCTLGGAVRLEAPHLLEAMKDRHRGRRCFVVGNGPSLNRLDMGRLRDEITFGSNRCYLGFEQWGTSFTYWAVTDRLQIEEYGAEYEERVPPGLVKFVPFEYLPLLRMDNVCPLDIVEEGRPRFIDTGAGVGIGYTVTYALLQVAAAMGCDPIILIGCDHRYPLAGPWHDRAWRRVREEMIRPWRGTFAYEAAQAWRRRRAGKRSAVDAPCWDAADAARPTHFDSGYTAGGQKRFLLPQLREARRDFRCAAQWAERTGARILNATPDSALDVFPRVDFDSLF